METLTVIAQSPPDDGKSWDCQCARCGSSLTWDACEACDGEGVSGHDCGEDCCCCMDPEDNVRCDFCRGTGGFYHCLSSHAWCAANPMPLREQVEGGTPEWFACARETA